MSNFKCQLKTSSVMQQASKVQLLVTHLKLFRKKRTESLIQVMQYGRHGDVLHRNLGKPPVGHGGMHQGGWRACGGWAGERKG